MDSYPPPSPTLAPDTRRTARVLILVILAFVLVALWTIRPNAVRAAVDRMESLIGRSSDAAVEQPAPSTADLEAKLGVMTPQGQAELLLSEAVNRRPGALDLLIARTGLWRGNLQETPHLKQLLESAWNSDDLQVRGASLEISLDIYDIEKTSASVSMLERRVADDPAARPWALWMLGALGNRGVEPIGVLLEELKYVKDPNQETRMWAVEGLATLGSSDSIEPLLNALRHDPSPAVRERAACDLGQAGMFTAAQRRAAVPHLLDMAEDSGLDPTTRGWVFHALQDITGTSQGANVQAWREWWQQHGA